MKNILIIAGPSAVGKTTVAGILLEKHPELEFVRSVTSRAPRGDGFDNEYIYLTKQELDAEIASGGVLEYTEYAGNCYGTPKFEIDRICAEGKTPLLILDIDGVKTVTSMTDTDISACAVYLYDDINVIDARLYERYLAGTPTTDGLKKYVKRKEQNIRDYLAIGEAYPAFYAFVRNTEPTAAASAVMSAFCAFISGQDKNSAECAEIAASLSASVSQGE